MIDSNLDLTTTMEQLIPSLGKQFYNIELAGMNIFDILKKAQEHKINIKLQGPTGSGKTTFFEAYCEKTKQPHFVSNMKGSTTSEELIGAYVPNDKKEGGQYIWKDGVIVRALRYSNMFVPVEVKKVADTFVWTKPRENFEICIENGEICKEDIISKNGDITIVKSYPKCMLTIEEINFSPEELMSVWFSLLDGRRNIVLNEKDGEVIHAGKFMSVNATMNPDYIGTNPLNAALNDRFLIKLDVYYDIKVENKLINEKALKYNITSTDIKTLKKFIHIIRKGKIQEECTCDISTRMIEAYLEIKGIFGDSIAEASLLNSFSADDLDFVKETLKIAKSDSNTINLSAEEMAGLDLANFKGYEPPAAPKTQTQTKKTNTKAPF